MEGYWQETGLLWEQILKIISKSGKVLVIDKRGITINNKLYQFYEGGILTIDDLRQIMMESI